jgi:hypothetical protein
MCTVTWRRRHHGYVLLFNRDELRSRQEARPPRSHGEDGGLPYLAPEDGDFGGTWLATNAAGITVGILNGPRLDVGVRNVRSRGFIVRDLATSSDLREVERRVRDSDLSQVRPFRLLAIGPKPAARVFEWDGRELAFDRDAETRMPLISSSFDETEVGRKRLREFRRIVGDDVSPERLHAYHRSHANGPSAYSVCMHREDAGTRSFSRVDVSEDRVSMSYRAGNPCEERTEVTVDLARASRSIRGDGA